MSHRLATVSQNEKSNIVANLGAHRLRAKIFHKLMRENPHNSTTLCFDLQQIQALPKLSISEAYYSRQINYHTLCITDTENKNPHFYVWTEDQAGRGSVEVASGFCDFLEKFEFPLENNSLRLFAGGCGGQNKNAHVVHAFSFLK